MSKCERWTRLAFVHHPVAPFTLAAGAQVAASSSWLLTLAVYAPLIVVLSAGVGYTLAHHERFEGHGCPRCTHAEAVFRAGTLARYHDRSSKNLIAQLFAGYIATGLLYVIESLAGVAFAVHVDGHVFTLSPAIVLWTVGACAYRVNAVHARLCTWCPRCHPELAPA